MNETQREQIKGALLKCAEENENKVTPTFCVVVSSVCKSAVERIEELEQKLEQTEKDLVDYQFNYPKIKELEQEDAGLKEQLQKKINTTTVSDYPYSALKLEEAKEIIKEILDTPQGWQSGCEWYENEDYAKVISRAEQFLKELEIVEPVVEQIKDSEIEK